MAPDGDIEVGNSLVEPEKVELARRLLDQGGEKLVLPVRYRVDFNPSSYNSNWGVGVRLLVLGNPLRLDFGIPLTSTSYFREDGSLIWENDTGSQFNFSFGTRF